MYVWLDTLFGVLLHAVSGISSIPLIRLELTVMGELVGLQAVALREARTADLALVGLLPRVDPQMPLQFERVGTGVGAMGTLVGPLPRMAPDVALQFRKFHARVVAFRALVRLLVRVSVAHVPHQLSYFK